MEKPIKACETCEFYMPNKNGDLVCGGKDEYYGKPVPEDFLCGNWECSLHYFMKLMDGLPPTLQKATDQYPSKTWDIIEAFYEKKLK